jgi:hypothetical protein
MTAKKIQPSDPKAVAPEAKDTEDKNTERIANYGRIGRKTNRHVGG